MYILKIKFKRSSSTKYCNNYIIEDSSEVRKETCNFPLKRFTMPLKDAKNLYNDLIFRYKTTSEEFLEYGKPEYIALVELSNYEPYSEYAVLDYYEKF